MAVVPLCVFKLLAQAADIIVPASSAVADFMGLAWDLVELELVSDLVLVADTGEIQAAGKDKADGNNNNSSNGSNNKLNNKLTSVKIKLEWRDIKEICKEMPLLNKPCNKIFKMQVAISRVLSTLCKLADTQAVTVDTADSTALQVMAPEISAPILVSAAMLVVGRFI